MPKHRGKAHGAKKGSDRGAGTITLRDNNGNEFYLLARPSAGRDDVGKRHNRFQRDDYANYKRWRKEKEREEFIHMDKMSKLPFKEYMKHAGTDLSMTAYYALMAAFFLTWILPVSSVVVDRLTTLMLATVGRVPYVVATMTIVVYFVPILVFSKLFLSGKKKVRHWMEDIDDEDDDEFDEEDSDSDYDSAEDKTE